MTALTTLFPVFFMLALGFVSRIKGWVTVDQKSGANTIVFQILFPILIFNVLLTSKIEASVIYIVAYVFIAFMVALFIGKATGRLTSEKYAHYSHYLLTTVEGGNVALPLYTSIVGVAYATNTVIFDLAGSLMAFIVIPIMVAKSGHQETSRKELFKQICTNSFVIAVALGLILNITGVYTWLSQSAFIDLYTKTIAMVTGPIMGMILFIIGYNLQIDMEKIAPLLKLIGLRVLIYVGIIVGFFILFPTLMADKTYMLAVLIYFMCPTGFAIPMMVSPLFKNNDDSSFASAYISLYMIVTLIVYTAIVLFIA